MTKVPSLKLVLPSQGYQRQVGVFYRALQQGRRNGRTDVQEDVHLEVHRGPQQWIDLTMCDFKEIMAQNLINHSSDCAVTVCSLSEEEIV